MGRMVSVIAKSRKLSWTADVFYALFSRLMPKMASTFLFIILLRQSGASIAGAYSLGIAFLTSSVLLSSLGLDELVIRQTAQSPFLSRHYLINNLLLRLFLSAIGYGSIVVLVVFILNYEVTVRQIILLFSLGIFPEGLNATMFAMFNARQKLKWMAFVSACVSFFQLGFGGVALWRGAELPQLIWIILGGIILGMFVNLYLSNRLVSLQGISLHVEEREAQSYFGQLNSSFLRRQLRQTLPFALIIILVSVDLQLDVILLSVLRDVTAVGIYSAARSLILFLALVPQAFRMVIYPVMAKTYGRSDKELREIYENSWRFLSLIGFPVVTGGLILAPQIVGLVYGDVSTMTTWTFRLLTFYLLILFLYIPGTRLLIVSGRQFQLSLFLAISLSVNILLAFLLAPRLGAFGTAAARVLSSAVYFLLVEAYVIKNILSHNGFSTAPRAIISTAIMAVFTVMLRNQALYIAVPFSVILYGGVLLIFGGTKNLVKMKWIN